MKKKPGYGALHIGGRKKFNVFRLINTAKLFTFGHCLLHQKFSDCLPPNGFAPTQGAPAPWLTCLWIWPSQVKYYNKHSTLYGYT